MEYSQKSSGVAKAGLTTGIIGTSLGALNALGGVGNILGGLGGAMRPMPPVNAEDEFITRYDAKKDAKIAELETQIALRDADTYTDRKMLELHEYYDSRIATINQELANQRVQNQATKDSFQLLSERMASDKKEVMCALNNEREARKCNDNTIVNYVNATFYPKMVADVTTGTTTTAQATYNPLPVCDVCC